MKKQILLLGIIAFFIQSDVFAQKFHIGSRIGLGETSMLTDFYPEDPKGQIDFQAGGSALVMLNQNLGLSADLLFNYHTAKANGVDTVKGVVNDSYYSYANQFKFFNLQVPLQLRFTGGSNKLHPYATGGVAINFSLISLESKTYDNSSYNDDHGYSDMQFQDMNPISFQYVGAIGLLIDTEMEKSYFIELKYQGPFTDAGTLGNQPLSFRTISLGGGYYF